MISLQFFKNMIPWFKTNRPKEPPKMTCDVCHTNQALGVASSGLVPMSFAWCEQCLQRPCEPESVFEYMYEMNPDIEDIHPECRKMETYKDGKYLTLEEWYNWRKTQPDWPDP